jgi:hypothetical protein
VFTVAWHLQNSYENYSVSQLPSSFDKAADSIPNVTSCSRNSIVSRVELGNEARNWYLAAPVLPCCVIVFPSTRASKFTSEERKTEEYFLAQLLTYVLAFMFLTDVAQL